METFLSIGLLFITAAGIGRDWSCNSRKPLGAAPTAQRKAAPLGVFADSFRSWRLNAPVSSLPPAANLTMMDPSAMLKREICRLLSYPTIGMFWLIDSVVETGIFYLLSNLGSGTRWERVILFLRIRNLPSYLGLRSGEFLFLKNKISRFFVVKKTGLSVDMIPVRYLVLYCTQLKYSRNSMSIFFLDPDFGRCVRIRIQVGSKRIL